MNECESHDDELRSCSKPATWAIELEGVLWEVCEGHLGQHLIEFQRYATPGSPAQVYRICCDDC